MVMPIEIGKLRLYSVEEIASLFSLNERSVRAMLREGRLQGRKLAKRWYVSESTLEQYFQEPEPAESRLEEEEEDAPLVHVRKEAITDIEERERLDIMKANREDEVIQEELRGIKADMALRSGLRAWNFQPGDQVRLLPLAQVTAQGHEGVVVAIEEPSPREPLGSVLVALHNLPPGAAPVAVSPDLLEPEG